MIKQVLTVGVLIFVAWIAASFVSGFIDGLLFAFLPGLSGGIIGMVISFLFFSMILGYVVIWLLRKFGH